MYNKHLNINLSRLFSHIPKLQIPMLSIRRMPGAIEAIAEEEDP